MVSEHEGQLNRGIWLAIVVHVSGEDAIAEVALTRCAAKRCEARFALNSLNAPLAGAGGLL